MRQRHVCPKCNHNRILLIERVPDIGEVSTAIRALHVATVVTGQGFFGGDILGSAGQLTATVCRACGYTELYTLDPAAIPIDDKLVHELVGPEPVAPYR